MLGTIRGSAQRSGDRWWARSCGNRETEPAFSYNDGPGGEQGEEATHLTETERERLLIWSAAELARRRRAKGLKLNYPEAVALICDEVMEKAREGLSLPETRAHGMRVLTREDVLEGVSELARHIEVEAVFPDGTKLVTLRDSIR